MNILRRMVRLLIPLAAVSILACAPSRAPSPFVIGVRAANDHAPFFIAGRQQLYRARGLDVAVRVMPSNTEIIEALQRGDLQVGAVPVTTAIAAIAQGCPAHIVAMTGRGGDGLLVRKQDGFSSLLALRGKRIATIRASILDVLLRDALLRAGLDPQRDVEWAYMSGLGDMIAALKTGQVAACSNTEPFLTDAERQGWGYVLARYTADWPGHPCCVVLARDDLARRDPAALREIVAVHCAAVDWANAHPDETAQIIVDTLQAFDPDLVLASLHPSRMAIDYRLEPSEIEHMASLMLAQGLIDRIPPTSRLLSLAPLQEALGSKP